MSGGPTLGDQAPLVSLILRQSEAQLLLKQAELQPGTKTWGRVCEACLAGGFRRFPAVDQVSAPEEVQSLSHKAGIVSLWASVNLIFVVEIAKKSNKSVHL